MESKSKILFWLLLNDCYHGYQEIVIMVCVVTKRLLSWLLRHGYHGY